jgi:hypothetical protein
MKSIISSEPSEHAAAMADTVRPPAQGLPGAMQLGDAPIFTARMAAGMREVNVVATQRTSSGRRLAAIISS